MKLFALAICLSCIIGQSFASIRRSLPISALREHTIATFSRIGNATTVAGVFNAGEQIPAIKLSVDKAVRILVADAEDGILAAHAIQQIATLSVTETQPNVDSNIEEDRRFEQLTECVDLCVTALPVSDLARYVWGMTVLGSTDEEKYANVISEYARRLSAHVNYKQTNSTISENQQKDIEDSAVHVLTARDFATMIWTVGCVNDVSGLANHTFVREAAQGLSECMQFDHNTASGSRGELSVKLAVRTIWSLALHQVNLKPLISQCLSIIFPTADTQSPLTVSTSLTLLWCLTEFKYLDVSVVTKLLNTIVYHLPGSNLDETVDDAYKRVIAPNVVQLYSSLLVLQDLCSDIVMAEDGNLSYDRQRTAYTILQEIQQIFTVTAPRLSTQQLADAPLSSTIVLLKALNTFDSTAALQTVVDACRTKVQDCLDADSVDGADACALLQAMCTAPSFPNILTHEVELAANMDDSSVAARSTSNSTRVDRNAAHPAPLQHSTKWMRLAGQLTVKVALYCTENTHNSALLINTAYSLAQLGTYSPMTDLLYKVPLQCLPDLSVNTCAKLLVTIYRDVTRRVEGANHQLSGSTGADLAVTGKLLERLHHAQRVAEAVRGTVMGIKSPSLQAQAVEALAALTADPPTFAGDAHTLPPTHDADPALAFAVPEPDCAEYPVSPILTPDPVGPAGELRTKEGYTIYPFEEEEGVITDTERLQALVRAVASGTGASGQSSSLGVAAAAKAEEVTHLGPTDTLAVGEADGQQQYPVSPVLAADPLPGPGEMRSPGGYTMFPYEQEEGVVTDTDRLRALVLAAANSNNTASARSSGPAVQEAPVSEAQRTSDRTTRTSTAVVSPLTSTEDTHDTTQYPTSPLLVPDPVGPTGELRSKEGYTIFPFDEQEGVVTNTDRLQALVRAAATSGGNHRTTVNHIPPRAVPHTVIPDAVDVDAAVSSAVSILPRFAPRRLRYLPHHMLRRLLQSYTTATTSYHETSKAIQKELLRREDGNQEECSTALRAAFTATHAKITLQTLEKQIQDLATTPSAPTAESPSPHFSSCLQALLRDWETAQGDSDEPRQMLTEKLLCALVAESDRIGSPASLSEDLQLAYSALLALCDGYLGDASITQERQGTVDFPVVDVAFVAGVLQETLAQCERQSNAHTQSMKSSSKLSSSLNLGKRLLTQFFRAFVN